MRKSDCITGMGTKGLTLSQGISLLSTFRLGTLNTRYLALYDIVI